MAFDAVHLSVQMHCLFYWRQSVYNIVEVHGSGDGRRAAKSEARRIDRLEFLGGNVSHLHQLGAWGAL